MQDSLPAGGLRLCREGVKPSGSLRKVSGYISILLSRTSPVARVVYAKRPFAGPKAVLAYLSRYTHRVAISNARLVGLDENAVTFRWKDYRIKSGDRLKTMTLAAHEFIRRFLLHVLPSGFHRIRHYGFLAGAMRAGAIERARRLLAAAEAAPQPSRKTDNPADDVSPARRCPCCGGRMIVVETFEGLRPWRSPPPTRIRIDSS